MVGIRVADVATAGKGRDDDERDARAIAEEVDRLKEAGIKIAAAFVEGDDERSVFGQLRMPLEPVKNAIDDAFQHIQLGGCRVAISKTVWFQVGDRRQAAMFQTIKEVSRIFDMRGALCRITHDGRGVLERIADVAI